MNKSFDIFETGRDSLYGFFFDGERYAWGKAYYDDVASAAADFAAVLAGDDPISGNLDSDVIYDEDVYCVAETVGADGNAEYHPENARLVGRRFLRLLDEGTGAAKLDRLPEGWKALEGATTAPKGWYWASNGKSRFSGEYEHALVRA